MKSSKNIDCARFEQIQAAQEEEWEALCAGCGACCGIVDRDPCEHLTEQQSGRYACEIYDNRFGMHRTRSGKPFRCVPIREILHKTWPGEANCRYKRLFRAPILDL